MERSALSTLAPSDAAVALRSLPRRAREHFRSDELAGSGTVDPSAPRRRGPSPVGLVRAATSAVDAMRKAIDRTLVHDDPALDAAVFDRTARDDTDAAGLGAEAAIAALASSAEALAADVDRTPLGDWDRPATVGGEAVTALDLLKEALASARTYLDELGPALDELRREA